MFRLYEGVAVHKRHNAVVTYQIEVSIEDVRHGFPIMTVNKSGGLPEGYLAVHPPSFVSPWYEQSICLELAA